MKEGISNLITLRFRNQAEDEIFFNLEKTTKLEKIFDAYAGSKGISPRLMKFTFDGYRITKEDTPKKLELEHDGIIEVFQEVLGGGVDEEESEEQEKKTPAADADTDNAAITLKVVDVGGDEMFFKVKKTTKMKKIMDAYADKKGVSFQSLRFMKDGLRIKEDDTPKMLEMEDDDQIDVRIETIGGGVEDEEEQKPNIGEKEDKPTADNVLTLQLKDQAGDILSFKVKDSSQMKKIFAAYAQRKGVPVETFRFLLDGNRVNPNDTPSSLSLEDNDQIDVMLEYAGGF
jgi:small ubiquitin-related modifier